MELIKKGVKVTALIVCFLIFNISNAQNYIYIGEERFEATPTWDFALETMYGTVTKEIEVTISKKNKGGNLLLSISDMDSRHRKITGGITIYLSDGSVIKCIDRNQKSRLNDRSYNLYNLTNSEIEQLKVTDIKEIVFSLTSFYNDIVFQNSEYYTAKNLHPKRTDTDLGKFGTHTHYYLGQYDTSNDISELFNE